MGRVRKTIPQMVEKAAIAWRDHMLKECSGNRGTPLERHVNEYMSSRFDNALDVLMGVERGWSRIELKLKDGNTPTIAGSLVQAVEPRLLAMGKELFDKQEFVLTERETATLRREYRKVLVEKLTYKVRELAEARATELAENTLNACMEDEEWISLLEGRWVPKEKKVNGDNA